MDDILHILDTCVFVKEGFLFEMQKIYVCPYSVIEEVKSPDAQIRLTCVEKQKGIDFVQPKEEFVETAKKLEKKFASKKGKLSRTDIDIIALALFFTKKNKKVCVVTDDVLIQKICKKNRIDYEPFFLLRKT
ncbi:MAG: hypothetical protein DRN66_00335 [Candidatus Nanohalarchaeota archaeon]|nr:MAG: hypothetical protein DRN66_00335 [Candidatus Nanohaloarchaeota archaeon]